MRVLILKPLADLRIGIRLDHLRVGEVYSLSPEVASMLIVEGRARVEMRHQQRRRHFRPGAPERRIY